MKQWVHQPWTIKRHRGGLFAEEVCEADPELAPVYDGLLTALDHWQEITRLLIVI